MPQAPPMVIVNCREWSYLYPKSAEFALRAAALVSPKVQADHRALSCINREMASLTIPLLTEVKSSNVFGVSAGDKGVYVLFTNGALYNYEVENPKTVCERMVQAQSTGKYLNENLKKPTIPCVKLADGIHTDVIDADTFRGQIVNLRWVIDRIATDAGGGDAGVLAKLGEIGGLLARTLGLAS